MFFTDETTEETHEETSPGTKAMKLRLDPEHSAALDRIAQFEHLKRQDTLRRLIRLADQIITADSPFAENLESLFQRKAG